MTFDVRTSEIAESCRRRHPRHRRRHLCHPGHARARCRAADLDDRGTTAVRLDASIEGSFKEAMTAEARRAARAVTFGIREATDGLKSGPAAADHQRRPGRAPGPHLAQRGLPERPAEHRRRRLRLEQGARSHPHLRSRAPSSLATRALSRDPDGGGRQVRRCAPEDHARRLGAHPWHAAAVRLPAGGAVAARRR